MPTEVLATRRAEQQISRLNRKQAKAFGTFLDELAAVGCRALAYRLSGPAPVDHLCVKHIGGPLRVVVAFETPRRAWILLVGPHDDRDPVLNVYAELYRLLGMGPPAEAGRDKPPCCDETADLPPVLGDTFKRDPRPRGQAPPDTALPIGRICPPAAQPTMITAATWPECRTANFNEPPSTPFKNADPLSCDLFGVEITLTLPRQAATTVISRKQDIP